MLIAALNNNFTYSSREHCVWLWPGAANEEDPPRVVLDITRPECHEAADAFWRYWEENGVPHKHGYYESTWGAINAALSVVGVRDRITP